MKHLKIAALLALKALTLVSSSVCAALVAVDPATVTRYTIYGDWGNGDVVVTFNTPIGSCYGAWLAQFSQAQKTSSQQSLQPNWHPRPSSSLSTMH